MSDVLTPRERQLIDEAVSAGKVTTCPPRATTDAAWQPIPLKKRINGEYKAAKRKRPPPDPATDPRRVQYESLSATMTAHEIAAHLGVHLNTVKRTLKFFGLKARSFDDKQQEIRLAQYKALIAEGLTAPQMAKRLGIGSSAVYENLRKMGLKARAGKRGQRSER